MPAPTTRARVARRSKSSFGVEALETRQLLSAATASATHHLRHHFHTGYASHPSATHDFVLTANAGSARAFASSSPTGLTPATVRQAYGINATTFNGVTGDGSGQTIAIVDAYNSPTIAADLQTFDTTFGLANPSLTVESQTGSTTTLPAVDPAGKGDSWAVETSLDVEWAHAVAPAAKILLIEASSSSLSDLFAAVDTARNAAGVSVVSMSWGGAEFSGDATYDTHFTTPTGHTGVTFVASSGDSGAYTASTTMGVQYLAASKDVLAVGGTRLSVDSSGNYLSESGWGSSTSSYSSGGAGGGISQYTSQPTFQTGVVTQSTTKRTVPDVAFLADPASGVAVVDSYDFGTTAPWLAVGGTSLAAPMWAGVIATVNQGRAVAGKAALDGPTGTLPQLYALPAADFHDVTTGNNGYAAAAGYDLVTGRGTPIVNVLAQALAGAATSPVTRNPIRTPTGALAPTVGSVAVSPTSVVSGNNATFTASNVTETGGTIASVKFYEETNGTTGLQTDTDSLVGTATQSATGTWTLTAGTVGVSAGSYTIYAVATDAAGTASTPVAATLTVTAATNDNFANATILTGSGVTATGTTVGDTRESGEPSIVNNRGGHSEWYAWTAPASGKVTATTKGSSFDTLLGVYTGSSVSALTLVGSNDDDTANHLTTSVVSFTAVAGTTYRIAIDGYNGASGTTHLTIG